MKNALVTGVSSGWGSVSRAGAGWPYAYCISKAALDMAMRIVAADTAPDGVVTVLLNPGWVRTAMSGPNASVAPADSVRGMLRVVAGLGPEDNGRFLNWCGEAEAW